MKLPIITICLFLLLGSAPALADGDDPSSISEFMLGFKADVERALAGERLDDGRYTLLCSMARGQMVRTELGKLRYNDQFHEIGSEEQAQDIREWAKNVEDLNKRLTRSHPGKDCDAAFRLWNTYDDKWYAPVRARKQEEREADIRRWESQIVDTGADVWDGVIGGTFFSIPREYIFFASNEADDYSPDMNVRFFYPDFSANATAGECKSSDCDIIGIIREEGLDRLPCTGYSDRQDCTAYPFQKYFTWNHMDCSRPDVAGEVLYRAMWRKECRYMAALQNDVKPQYDDEVGMWRLGTSGYYEGLPEFPTYWLKCAKFHTPEEADEIGNRICETAFQIDDATWIYYSFPRRLFWKHREIQQALREKTRGFIVIQTQKDQTGDL